MQKKALITGFTGQDGSYLAELLLSKGYEVHATTRGSSDINYSRVQPILEQESLMIHHADLTDQPTLNKILIKVRPQEIYNLAAQSHVHLSREMPEHTADVTALGVIRLLEIVRNNGLDTKFYQASSSEMFGSAAPKQSESTGFAPRNPYACAKTFAYWMVHNYRRDYGLFACNGILFNHESPRRGEQYVTRKITYALAQIVAGLRKDLHLGNLDARRDWGFAPEYVEVMWKMLQRSEADDYVIGTGTTHTVREFLDLAFDYAGLDVEEHVTVDEGLFRPPEQNVLVADSRKASKMLDWEPTITFPELVKIMVDADLRRQGVPPIGEGDDVLRRKFPGRWWGAD
jgi:GDPmannose 4,6-dehydratase